MLKRVLVTLMLIVMFATCACTTDNEPKKAHPTPNFVDGSKPGEAQNTEAQGTNPITTPAVDTYVRGTLTNTDYFSTSIATKFTLPDGYYFIPQSELDTLTVFDAGVSQKDSEGNVNYKEARCVYEMKAECSDGLPYVLICVEKFSSSYTAARYAMDFRNKMLEYEDAKYIVEDGVQKRKLAGNDYIVLLARIEGITGSDIIILQDHYIREISDRIVCITITYTEETRDKANVLMARFVSIN